MQNKIQYFKGNSQFLTVSISQNYFTQIPSLPKFQTDFPSNPTAKRIVLPNNRMKTAVKLASHSSTPIFS